MGTPASSSMNSAHSVLKATFNRTQPDPIARSFQPAGALPKALAVAPLELFGQFLRLSCTLPANLIRSIASLRRVHIVSYEHLRRSSRIPKEVAILLTGSDMDGKSFSE